MHYSTKITAMGLNHYPALSVVIYAAAGTPKRRQPLPVVPRLAVELNLLGGELRAALTEHLVLVSKAKRLTAAQARHLRDCVHL